jgi:heat shock protein HtpX
LSDLGFFDEVFHMPKAWRAWLVLSGLSILTLYLGDRIAERQGVLWAVVAALCLNMFFYFYGDLFLKPLFKGRSLEGRDPWDLRNMLEKLALAARVTTPGVTVLPQLSPQAFAIARSWGSSRIYLTEGLLRRLSEKEIQAILAFELALIKRLDTFSMSVASAFLMSLLSLTRALDWVARWLLGTKNKIGSRYNHLFTSLLSPLAGLLIRLTLSEKDFYAADQMAAQWTDAPEELARALWKLQSLKQTQPWPAPASTAHLFVVNPLNRRGWTRHLQIQPATEARIKKLVGHYPL